MLNGLFEGYKVASDKSFVAYICKKRDEYNDSTVAMELDTLMYQASNYYVTSSIEAEEWERPTQEEEQIIALEAQIKQLEAHAANFASNPSSSGSPCTPKSEGNARDVKPPWMTEPPAGLGEPQTKVVNGKEYHWCPNHIAWVCHLPSDCEGKGVKPSESRLAPPSTPSRDDEGPKRLKLSNALAAVIQQDEDREEAFP